MNKRDLILSGALTAALVTGAGGMPMATAAMKCGAGMMGNAGHAKPVNLMPTTTRRLVKYTLPKVNMVREDGKHVSLPHELNDGRPVVLTFVFTTCTAICPLISHTLEQLQDKLGADRNRVHLATISIDPENDTPTQLTIYGKKYHAGPEWHSYTGTYTASMTVQKAFDVYHGDKMDHDPVIFLRHAPGQKWVRIDGFATADGLLNELRSMLAEK